MAAAPPIGTDLDTTGMGITTVWGITDIGVLRISGYYGPYYAYPGYANHSQPPCFYLVAGAGFEPATFGIMSATPNACNLLIINYYSDSFEEFGQKFLQCFR